MRLTTRRAFQFATAFSLTLSSVAIAAEPTARRPLVAAADLDRSGLSEFWAARLPFVGDEAIRAAYRVDDAVYVVSTRNRLFSIAAEFGLLRWGIDLTAADFTVHPPSHVRTAAADGPAVVATTSETFVIDRFNGAVLTKFTPPFPVGSPAVAQGSAAFMGSIDRRFYAMHFDASNRGPAIKMWDVMAGGPVTAKPLLLGPETLVFASHSGTVYACLATDKAFQWSYRTGDAVTADPAVDATGVYVASNDRSLYKLSPRTGSVIWRVRFPRPLVEGPIALGNTVFQFCPGEGLAAIDADSGKDRWRNPAVERFAARAGASDVLFTSGQRLLIVHSETGRERAGIPAAGAFDVITNTQDATVYLLGQPNQVMALRLGDDLYLRRQQVMAARRELNLDPLKRAPSEPPVDTARRTDDTDPLANDPLRSRRDVPPR